MKKFSTLLLAASLCFNASSQLIDYKKAETNPNANYFEIVKQWRTYLNGKEQTFKTLNPQNNEQEEQLREEIAQFERWAYDWHDKVDANGNFPSAAQGWINLLKTNLHFFDSNNNQTARTQAAIWTSIGPQDVAVLNGWTYGAGIGRVNVVRKHPTQTNIVFAGTAAGGIFKSTNNGGSWTPVSDNLAGLGISDIAFDPITPSTMYAATGDYDGNHMSSIGVYKSTDGGNTWNATGLTFTLDQSYRIAHIAVDPTTPTTLYATGKDAIHQSLNGGLTWTTFYSAGTNFLFNDIVKIGTNWYVSDKFGSIYKSNPLGTDASNNFTEIYNNGKNQRLDFAYSPANPDTLYLLSQSNPAFSKISVSAAAGTQNALAYTNITNENPTDDNANFNTQNGYNQVIAVSPTNKDSIWVGEFSGGKLSTDGGKTWKNKLNGYYDPNSTSANWGGFYVHSDFHDITFFGSDSLLIGNDGGVYLGKISTNSYAQLFNGLVATQSYSIAIYDPEPSNLITGNQDNDGSSRILENNVSTFYGAQAGDGTATAIARTNPLLRYLGGTKGALSYRNDGFKGGYSGTGINTPTANAPFVWDLQMHNTDGTILYGGFADINKMTGAPNGTWASLNSGINTGIQSITLANRDATTQKIIVIGTNGSVRKTSDETTWSDITPPAGVTFNSIYAKKNNWDTLFATASGYNAANKIFISTNNGVTWTNITKNFPNIKAKKIIAYEGTDTVFIATELGVYFGRVTDATTARTDGANPWSKFGTGLPNVRVEDMEISYTKKQLFIASFGRGVWMTDISSNVVLPVHALDFTYVKTMNGNSLKWNIQDDDVVKTVLEKSYDGSSFKEVAQFTGTDKKLQNGYAVANESATVYYRLNYTKASGQQVYSYIIVIRSSGSNTMVNVYPNPTRGNIFVSSDKLMLYVRFFTTTGHQIAFAKPQNNFYAFDMSLLPKGVYVLEVTDVDGNKSQQKIIRE